jgi:predicted dehydrogenase
MKLADYPPLRAAVVGCGVIANEHLKYLATSPIAMLVGVCDRSEAIAKFAQNRFAAKSRFSDAAEMLRETRPDIVHVLTPPDSHVALATAALEAKAHVICEKPIAPDANAASDLFDIAEREGRFLFESRNYLFNDIVKRLLEFTNGGRLGDIVEAELSLSLRFLDGPFGDLNLEGPAVRLPGGVIHDFLPHLAYLFLEFTGHRGPVDEVRGFLDNLSGNPRAGYDHLDALVVAGGKRGRLRIAADVAPDLFQVYIRGSRATVETDLYNPYLRFDGPPNIGKRTSLGQLENSWQMARAGVRNFKDKVLQHGPYHGMPRMLDAIYSSIAAGTSPPFSRGHMMDSIRLVDRVLELRH